jgi:Protein of unknown function (DUF559)
VGYEVVEDRPLSAVAEDSDELAGLLASQAGVISRQQAAALMTLAALRHRAASGRWRQVHRGVFVTHRGPITDSQRNWIAVLAASAAAHAYLGGLTALLVAGLRNVRGSGIHVLVPATRRVVKPPAGVIVHRAASLPIDHREPYTKPPRTTPARSVVDGAQWARSDNEARLIVASSFQQRLVDLSAMEDVLTAMPRAHRRALVLRTAWDCAGGSHSLGELDFFEMCLRGGLPVPSRQVERRDRAGRRRYLDIYFDSWKIVVEIDGAHHMNVGQMWDDARRQNDLELAGYVVLRYPVFVIRHQPEMVLAEIRQALTAAGWRDPL